MNHCDSHVSASSMLYTDQYRLRSGVGGLRSPVRVNRVQVHRGHAPRGGLKTCLSPLSPSPPTELLQAGRDWDQQGFLAPVTSAAQWPGHWELGLNCVPQEELMGFNDHSGPPLARKLTSFVSLPAGLSYGAEPGLLSQLLHRLSCEIQHQL